VSGNSSWFQEDHCRTSFFHYLQKIFSGTPKYNEHVLSRSENEMKKLLCLLLFLVTSVVLAQSPVAPGALLEKVATGFLQPEGPVWKDGAGLLFSDIQRSTI
jgi:hypothetical protein